MKEDKLKYFLFELCFLINSNKFGEYFYYLIDARTNTKILYFDDNRLQIINSQRNIQNNYAILNIMEFGLKSIMEVIGLENINSAQWERISINSFK